MYVLVLDVFPDLASSSNSMLISLMYRVWSQDMTRWPRQMIARFLTASLGL